MALASKMSLRFYVVFRYLRRLHISLKKGRWNPKEEEKLIELIEKYGVGKSQGAFDVPVSSGFVLTAEVCSHVEPGALPRSQAAAPVVTRLPPPSARQMAVSPWSTGSRPR